MLVYARRVLVVGLLALLWVGPVHGQVLGGNEYVAGTALNVALRGPYVTAAWRKPIVRFVLSQVISAGYELAIDRNGWNARDLGGRAVGYLLTEALVAAVRGARSTP